MPRKKGLESLRRQQKKRIKARAAQERFLQQARNEFLGPFVDEYRRVCDRAKQEHSLLIGIFECSDDVFYDLDTNGKLAHFGFGQFQEKLLDVVGELDFDSDPTTREGTINKHRPRTTGISVTGCTSIVTDGKTHKVFVFMREATGGSDEAETTAALKLTALLHELGHVTDIEQGINYWGDALDLVKAEIFAHHYACSRLIDGRYRLPLGYYLDGIEEMANSSSEYVRVAAKEVVDSPNWAKYKAAISPFYGFDKNS